MWWRQATLIHQSVGIGGVGGGGNRASAYDGTTNRGGGGGGKCITGQVCKNSKLSL